MKQFRTGRKRNRKAQDRRRESALIRQEIASKRSVAQRIEILDNGGFAATRERVKLAAMEA